MHFRPEVEATLTGTSCTIEPAWTPHIPLGGGACVCSHCCCCGDIHGYCCCSYCGGCGGGGCGGCGAVVMAVVVVAQAVHILNSVVLLTISNKI